MAAVAEKIRFSVVVPCYNEGGNIVPLLDAFKKAFLERVEKSAELILVDNNSTDGTAEILSRELGSGNYLFARTVFEPRPGYGAAIKRGLAAARGDVLAWTHADLQADPGDVFRAYDEFVRAGGETVLVKGNRVGRPLGQVIFSFGMAAIASVVLGARFFEINAQPKLFHRRFLPHLKNAPDDFSLDLYLLYQARKRGYDIRTVDVRFNKRLRGESKWAFSVSSKIKTIARTLRYIVALKKSP